VPRFSTVLVANRGEIACRILRTARSLGYRTVAVYSEADRAAPHVQAADTAVCIGPAPAAASYLDGARILEAARRTGAGAIHPGYGFLSENADFAASCEAAGVVFVGPPATAIRTMGDKTAAKAAAAAAGVPVVPGDLGPFDTPDDLAARAEAVGFPLLVKAAAGGGGRGMRRVEAPAALAAAVAAAEREAQAAFGDGRVFLERVVEGARHVEVQILADRHGTVRHLGERDGSVQRRHQKVVEEAPSPAVDARLRRALGDAAVAVARAVGYVGAGTVEFLLAPDGAFYFLEMNTRLQVEHPVTELVYGIDLVAWQFWIAQGRRLDPTAIPTAPTGHAVEARLYAEDPRAGFVPQAGTVVACALPEGPGLRCDMGVATGSAVPPHYDPLLGKIVACGATRDEALQRLRRALAHTVLLGVRTNRTFLGSVLADETFTAGRADCTFLDDFDPPPADPADLLAAAALIFLEGPDRIPAHPWRNSGTARAFLDVAVDGAPASWCVVFEADGTATVHAGGRTRTARILRRGPRSRVEVEGVALPLFTAWKGDELFVATERFDLHVAPHRPSTHPEDAAGEADRITAPAAGRVLAVTVRPGDEVRAGAPAVTLESMKMETTLTVPCAGVVEAVFVQPHDAVAAGDVLVTLTPRGRDSEETPS